MFTKLNFVFLSLALSFSINVRARSNEINYFKNTKYVSCFTPGDNCIDLIAITIASAKKELLIQAYSFTSIAIAQAMLNAQNRGVIIKVILDKGQFSDKGSFSKFLDKHHLLFWKNDTPNTFSNPGVLHKNEFIEKYSFEKLLLNQKIPVWNDESVNIAHNKTMIIDENIVITGSFNFTTAAQNKNAENLLVIYDKALALAYKNNWLNRMKVSQKMN